MTEFSSVFIGFVDQSIKNESSIDWFTNKIGGEASFPETIDDHQLTTIINSQLICTNCRQLCSPILQIQSSVDDNPSLRVIYVFACLQNDCNHFIALRLIHHQQSSPSNLFSSQQSNFQRGKLVPKNLSARAFKPFYVYVESLEDLKYNNSLTAKQSKYKLDGDDIPNNNGEGEKYENPEVSTVFANDKVSYKFYKSLRDWPDQIVRYSWQGQPLLNKSIGNLKVDECSNCGSQRKFEFQLMPGLISKLKPLSSSQSSNNIDFGTILIYCCSNNCDNRQFNEEKTIFLEDLDNNAINGFVSSHS